MFEEKLAIHYFLCHITMNLMKNIKDKGQVEEHKWSFAPAKFILEGIICH